jgi:hypothetical protein
MKRMLIPALAVLAALQAAAIAQTFPELSKKVPFLKERLASSRWQVRYALIPEIDASEEGKRVLETLIKDEHLGVANQAQTRYLRLFLKVDKAVLRADAFVAGLVASDPFRGLSPAESRQLLLDYCRGGKPDARFRGDGDGSAPLPLDPAQRDNPGMADAITILGVLGEPADAEKLTPFLESTNDYVAVNAARALARLGQKDKAIAGLERLLKQEPQQHLYYMTEALRVLREIDVPLFKQRAGDVLKAVGKKEIQSNFLNEFLLVAAEADPEALK